MEGIFFEWLRTRVTLKGHKGVNLWNANGISSFFFFCVEKVIPTTFGERSGMRSSCKSQEKATKIDIRKYKESARNLREHGSHLFNISLTAFLWFWQQASYTFFSRPSSSSSLVSIPVYPFLWIHSCWCCIDDVDQDVGSLIINTFFCFPHFLSAGETCPCKWIAVLHLEDTSVTWYWKTGKIFLEGHGCISKSMKTLSLEIDWRKKTYKRRREKRQFQESRGKDSGRTKWWRTLPVKGTSMKKWGRGIKKLKDSYKKASH